MGKALTYVGIQRAALRPYLANARLIIDTNVSRRMPRAHVVGRKNWEFFGEFKVGDTKHEPGGSESSTPEALGLGWEWLGARNGDTSRFEVGKGILNPRCVTVSSPAHHGCRVSRRVRSRRRRREQFLVGPEDRRVHTPSQDSRRPESYEDKDSVKYNFRLLDTGFTTKTSVCSFMATCHSPSSPFHTSR